MTTLKELQQHLKDTGRYAGAIDGLWGPATKKGVLKFFEDGPDTALNEQDYIDSAKRLGVTPAHIKAVVSVESSGAGFFRGRPLILPEPHRFSRWTGHRFDQTNPTISYPNWGMRPYVKTQDERYEQLCAMIHLDVDGGFACASYGKFQIMGENFKACGFASPMSFAESMARNEKSQLQAFENFIKNNGLLGALRAGNWAGFAKGYNGSAYAQNRYDVRLRAAYITAGGK